MVAKAQRITGIKKTSRKNESLKTPARAPIRVRIRQFNPRGAAERKSRKSPEKKPETCPDMVPLT